MKKTRTIVLITAALLIGQCARTAPVVRETQPPPAERTEQPAPAAEVDWYGFYSHNKLDSAVPALEKHLKSHPADYSALAYYAESLRRLGRLAEADSVAREILSKQSCSAFALSIRGDIFNPQYAFSGDTNRDSALSYYKMAVRCDSLSGGDWEKLWIEGLRGSDTALASASLSHLYHSGYYTSRMLAIARWFLRDLPANAVLLTNGDMDTYPLRCVQQEESLRPDVAVINVSLLNLRSYFEQVTSRNRLQQIFSKKELSALFGKQADSTPPSEKIITRYLQLSSDGRFGRPLCLLATVNQQYFGEFQPYLCLEGPFYRFAGKNVKRAVNPDSIMKSLRALKAGDFKGPAIGSTVRSPVILSSEGAFDSNIFYAALSAAMQYKQEERFEDALSAVQWVEQFGAEMGAQATMMEYAKRFHEGIQQAIEQSKKNEQ